MQQENVLKVAIAKFKWKKNHGDEEKNIFIQFMTNMYLSRKALGIFLTNIHQLGYLLQLHGCKKTCVELMIL